MLSRNLFLLASAALLLVAPVAQHHLFGMDTTVKDQKVVSVKDAVSDEMVTVAVKDAFAKDNAFVKFTPTVKVTTVGGVVTLTGTVDSEKAKADLGAKAQSVGGVKSVDNKLEVKVVK